MGGFAPAQFRPQGVDEAARAQHAREGVVALGAVQLEAEFAGQVEPDGDFLLFPRGGVVLGQTVQHIAANEVAEEVGFGRLGDVLQVIDLAARQGVQHKGAVVLEGDQVHQGLRLRAAGLGGGSRSVFSNRSMVASMRRWSLTRAARAWRKRR